MSPKKNATIAGIQQIGIGVRNAKEAFDWYRRHFGMDIPIFEEAAEARYMTRYTGDVVHSRHAILALNIRGGGGFEIWQFTSREPADITFEPMVGDLGIMCTRIKSTNIEATHDFLTRQGANPTEILKDPIGHEHFYLRDPWNNLFQVVESHSWFSRGPFTTGGVAGCQIGVTDMSRSMAFYANILGYNKIVYDKEGVFEDLAHLPGGDKRVHRILLSHTRPRVGAFSELLGVTEIELIKVFDREPRKLFEDRFWGDLGYIHLCFDITNQDAMRKRCKSYGHPYTVDSGSTFDMGEAAGHFSYIEDPDGTLIEFVETRKIPIMKRFGWYLDLTKRDPTKSLPRFMLKALAFGRVKDKK